MSRKLIKSTKGSLLIEAMIGLFILCTILVIILPQLYANVSRKKELESQSDLYRVLYEASRTWNGQEKYIMWQFNEQNYRVTYFSNGLTVVNEDGVQVDLAL
ncbi:competence type IV pilus minor pilin ComGE [Allofustis seminis]|uniref:competence type IV pilus minor pilin ComGE n=1 Tax=Allofustis seminis TaxID=166939 RepID=UPI000364335D|nr:competence type IV pilus minor pilin ComGE [Allofustis seminis]